MLLMTVVETEVASYMFDAKGQRLDNLLHIRMCNELKQQYKKFKQVLVQSTTYDCV